MKHIQNRNVLDDKHYIQTKNTLHSPIIRLQNTSDTECNAYNYGLPDEMLYLRVGRKVMTNYNKFELTPEYHQPSMYEHLSRFLLHTM